MFNYALRVLRQVNDMEKAEQGYKKEAEKCSPPLEEKRIKWYLEKCFEILP